MSGSGLYKHRISRVQVCIGGLCEQECSCSNSISDYRYPAETMTLIAELSKDVAADFRKGREGKLKRTFVAASNAAAAKFSKK